MDAYTNFASDARAFGGGGGGGGGFVPSQPADQLGGGGGAFGGGGSALKNRGGGGGEGKRETSTLRALTVRQLLHGQQAADDAQGGGSDKAVVDGADVHNATLLGRIVSVQEGGQRTTLALHDGTGSIEVSKWRTDDEPGGGQAQQRLAVGAYVRVFGHLRAGGGRSGGGGGGAGGGAGGGMSFHAFAVRPVTDHNEVTYHLLQCVFQHAHLTRGGLGTGKPLSGGAAAAGGFGAAPAAYGVGAYGPAAAPSAAPAAAGPGAHRPGSLQEAITAVLGDGSVGETGLHVNEVVQRVRAAAAAAAGGGGALAQASLGDVQAALSALMNEALAYTTVDDNHWKST